MVYLRQLSKMFLIVLVYTIYFMSNIFDVVCGLTDDCETFDCDALANYLSWIDTSPITYVLDELFPPDRVKKWIYSPLLLLKLLILQDKKKLVTVH
jgi:hypothetical protein